MKDKIVTISFVSVIFLLCIFNIIIKDNDVSYSERRKLAKFPNVSTQTLLDGSFTSNFEKYTLDQFSFRDNFRTIKANLQFNVLRKLDNNGIFVDKEKIYKMEYPLNEKSITNFTNKINSINSKYLKNANVYYSIVPDKNYYLNNDKYLKLDYKKLINNVNNNLKNIKYIDITNVLSLNDYYNTDTHWKQERLKNVALKLSQEMGFKVNTEYEEKVYEPFYGVYYGQSALNIKPDKITYLTNKDIEEAIVYNYEDSSNKSVYNISKLGKMDSYDVFLSGATPFLTIENKNNNTNKELVIFRDSFGSSLAPLLVSSYSKITLIDLRYIDTASLEKLIEFNNQDILFLYSTLIINNSDILRK